MNLIWATRGRTWGFRFLRNGGYDDPLPVYDAAFSTIGDKPEGCGKVEDERVAVRFLDPDRRKDASGRVIPHDFVVLGPESLGITTVDDGLSRIWPMVADEFARVWDQAEAPPPAP